MAQRRARANNSAKRRVKEAMAALASLGFGPRQRNELAGFVLLALLDLKPDGSWTEASNPLRGITPIIEFIAEHYAHRYAPNTRETVRDEAVKHFVESGMVARNPDDASRPTNSGNTIYQVEAEALDLLRAYGTPRWSAALTEYLAGCAGIRGELDRRRQMVRIPVRLPGGEIVTLSPGGQNPLIKQVVEEFCSRFAPGGVVVYLGDAETKFKHFHADYLARLGALVDSAAKMPDVVVHDTRRDWLLLIEAVTSAGPVDSKRRKELKDLFRSSTAGLVFVTAFETRRAMQRFLTQISWETEVWVAEDQDHLIHFNGERFLGPYPDVSSRRP
jgi:hypothetical protein